MIRQIRLVTLLFLATGGAACATAGAATPKPQNGPAAAGASSSVKTVEEVTKGSRRIDGLFTLFQDTITGSAHLLVRPEQIGQEFIYWAHTVDGVVDAGHFRGAFGDNRVLAVERDFDQLRFVVQPTQFHFEDGHALSRAANANVSPAVLVLAALFAIYFAVH